MSENDPEIKENVTVNVTVIENGFNKVISYFSDWMKLKRRVTWLMRFQVYCVHRFETGVKVQTGEFTVNEVKSTERALLIYVQRYNSIKIYMT